jgi:hypothetical protein
MSNVRCQRKMWQYLVKILVSALVIVAITEVARRSSLWAAALASLPLTSLLAFVWLHVDSASTEQVAALSQSIFWLVIPSLVLFALFPVLLRAAWGFWPSLTASCIATAGAYVAMLWFLPKAGIRL